MEGLEDLLAKQAIVELIGRYAHAIDRCDCDLLERMFVPGAMLHYGLFDGPAADLIAHRRVHGSAFIMTHHFTGSVLACVQGDRARAQSYLSVVHRAEREGRLLDEHVRARYLDKLERHDGRWLFAERTLVFDWSWTTEAAAAGPEWWDRLGSGALTGSRTDDPSTGFGFLEEGLEAPRGALP